MTKFRVTKVCIKQTKKDPHDHITGVELDNRRDWRVSRSTVIANLNSPTGDRYYTLAGGKEAEVVVRDCPNCSSDDYITTLPDSTTKNNLLDLKRYE